MLLRLTGFLTFSSWLNTPLGAARMGYRLSNPLLVYENIIRTAIVGRTNRVAGLKELMRLDKSDEIAGLQRSHSRRVNSTPAVARTEL